MKVLTVSTILLVLASAAGCNSLQPANPSTRANRDHLTHKQIQASGLATAYDLIQAERMSWLRERHRPYRRTDEAVAVYLDGAYFGGTESLHNFATRDILSLRRIRPEDTLRLLGRDHPNGAILVSRYESTFSQQR